MIFTNYGKDAIAAAAAGKTVITFTALKTSDTGALTTGSYPDFRSIKQSVAPSSITIDSSTNTAKVTGLFNNNSLGAAYSIKGIGLYATCAGEFALSTPRLFAYEILSTPDYMPLLSEAPSSYTYMFNTTISDASVVSISLEPSQYALAQDLQELTTIVHENEPPKIRVRCNLPVETSAKPPYKYLQEVSLQGLTSNYKAICDIEPTTIKSKCLVETAQDKLILWFLEKPPTNMYINIVCIKAY